MNVVTLEQLFEMQFQFQEYGFSISAFKHARKLKTVNLVFFCINNHNFLINTCLNDFMKYKMSSKFRSISALEQNCEGDSNYAGLASINKTHKRYARDYL